MLAAVEYYREPNGQEKFYAEFELVSYVEWFAMYCLLEVWAGDADD